MMLNDVEAQLKKKHEWRESNKIKNKQMDTKSGYQEAANLWNLCNRLSGQVW